VRSSTSHGKPRLSAAELSLLYREQTNFEFELTFSKYFFMYVPCTLYSSLSRPTNVQHIYIYICVCVCVCVCVCCAFVGLDN